MPPLEVNVLTCNMGGEGVALQLHSVVEHVRHDGVDYLFPCDLHPDLSIRVYEIRFEAPRSRFVVVGARNADAALVMVGLHLGEIHADGVVMPMAWAGIPIEVRDYLTKWVSSP
jgi:hypothetical protein